MFISSPMEYQQWIFTLRKYLPFLDVACILTVEKKRTLKFHGTMFKKYMCSPRQPYSIKVKVFMLNTLTAKFLLSFCMQQDT